MENWPGEDSLVREDCLCEKIRITQLTNPGLLRQIFLYIMCHNPIMQQSNDTANQSSR